MTEERENTIEIFTKFGTPEALAHETEINVRILRERFGGISGYYKVTIEFHPDNEVEDE